MQSIKVLSRLVNISNTFSVSCKGQLGHFEETHLMDHLPKCLFRTSQGISDACAIYLQRNGSSLLLALHYVVSEAQNGACFRMSRQIPASPKTNCSTVSVVENNTAHFSKL